MKIRSVESFPFHAERDFSPGTAGSPAPLLATGSHYRWAETYPVLYSTRFETALVRLTLQDGTYGWGEAQAPVAPEVACAIIDRILKPIVEGAEFEGEIEQIRDLWWTMYATMRVRGQTGGFMLDAIAGIDLALWDCAGKLKQKPVAELICQDARVPQNRLSRSRVKAYLSGLPAGDPEKIRPFVDQGIDVVKIFHQASIEKLLANCNSAANLLGSRGRIAVDGLWRLTPETARNLDPELASRNILFLEAPLAPEDAKAHGDLASAIDTPIAIGESYRTVFELAPFFSAAAMRIVQPDLGRTGITEALNIAEKAANHSASTIPHVSIAMGPQIAAAIHFAAAAHCPMLEFNPNVVEMANRYLQSPIVMRDGHYDLPQGPGLGIELNGFAEQPN